MRKIIAALNMTLDGVCDHNAGLPDEEIHQHYTELLGQGDAILYGRTTYQLMEFWRTILENPSEQKTMNDFAVAIDKIQKIVFSHTLDATDWGSATIAKHDLKSEVLALKQQTGKDIFVGSRSLIIQLLKLNLIDEFQLCIYPMVEGKGLAFFEGISDRIIFNLVKTKIFKNGSLLLYYQLKNDHPPT
ncbi:dihydrofolate reductase family protein [Fulvivirga sp.]|uniref:dihydrofolate reductase family protein n=1 Tax=Fulvivirga sp. TaxID=1931237 RepID=UPI0032F09213